MVFSRKARLVPTRVRVTSLVNDAARTAVRFASISALTGVTYIVTTSIMEKLRGGRSDFYNSLTGVAVGGTFGSLVLGKKSFAVGRGVFLVVMFATIEAIAKRLYESERTETQKKIIRIWDTVKLGNVFGWQKYKHSDHFDDIPSLGSDGLPAPLNNKF